MGDSSSMNRTLNDNDAVQLTGKIMMIAVLVLFLVVLFVLCLHLYAKWCWWRAEDDAAAANSSNHRRRRRRFVFAPGQDPVATVRKGLEPLVLRSLPVIVFPSDDFKDGLECAVCLSELVEGEKARLLPKCSHGFHVDCIDMWFQSHSTCPLCRNPVAPEVSGDSSSAGPSSMAAESLTIGQTSSPGENSASGFSLEGPNFPTNVLFWGDQTRVSSRVGSGLEEDGPGPSGSSSAPSDVSRPEMLVIDILNEASFVIPSASPSPSGNRYAADEDLKSPVTTRLRSLKRLLSRDRRISPSSPTSSVDVEQGGRGAQS